MKGKSRRTNTYKSKPPSTTTLTEIAAHKQLKYYSNPNPKEKDNPTIHQAPSANQKPTNPISPPHSLTPKLRPNKQKTTIHYNFLKGADEQPTAHCRRTPEAESQMMSVPSSCNTKKHRQFKHPPSTTKSPRTTSVHRNYHNPRTRAHKQPQPPPTSYCNCHKGSKERPTARTTAKTRVQRTERWNA
ncbi:hypothetical protein Ancab_022168 [Ancistrocladus abbreviatus]